jgi:hypothetical protein
VKVIMYAVTHKQQEAGVSPGEHKHLMNTAVGGVVVVVAVAIAAVIAAAGWKTVATSVIISLALPLLVAVVAVVMLVWCWTVNRIGRAARQVGRWLTHQ